MTEQTESTSAGVPWWIWLLALAGLILVVVLLWRIFFWAFIILGMWPIMRIFWGGLKFWAR